MAAATSIFLPKKTQEAFIALYNEVQGTQQVFRSNTRARYEKADRQYQREMDALAEQKKAAAANEAGDTTKFQNMTVPVVMPAVEASVTHQTSVFLSGNPMFGVVASNKYIDEALQLETVLDNQAVRGGWTREFILFFRDGYKYNFSAVEVPWVQEVSYTVETDIIKSTTEGLAKQVIWSGNKVKRLDPYNVIIDPNVAPTEIYEKGEYAGYTELMPRMQLKSFVASLPDKIIANIPDAFASGMGSSQGVSADSKNYYVPTINKKVIAPEDSHTGTNWMAWADLAGATKNMDYKDMYEVTTIYFRILPSEFNLRIPAADTPQVFKLIIVNHEHIIYCERQTNAHNWIPIFIGQPNEDGLRYQTKSQADNVTPFQEVASAYMNSIIASRRRAISDRTLYDPSRVDKAAINSSNPSAKIPVRAAAYGKPLQEAVYAFPYREDQAANSMVQIQQLIGLANNLVGQNQVSQGQFVKGNRTLEEFDTVMQNATGRDQTVSVLYEAQVFVPLKHVLKLNVLQYQGGTTLYNRDKQVEVEIDPVKLRTAVMEMKVSDGLIPTSKLINTDEFIVALQVLGSAPTIAAGYNLAPMFSYLMKIKGANVSEFEKSPEQIAYEQALAAWQQLAMTAVEKGIAPEKLPPQPKPQEFNYDPAGEQQEQAKDSIFKQPQEVTQPLIGEQ